MNIAAVGFLALAVCAAEQEPQKGPVKAGGHSIQFEVLIADLKEAVEAPTALKIQELEKTGNLQARVRFQLSVIEDAPATIQFAERVPRVIGFSGRGARSIPLHQDADVGTNLRVTARVGDDKTIVTQFFLERTALAGEAEKPAEPNAASAPPAIDRMQSNTTLKLKSGEPQVIGGQQTGAGKETNRTWIVVTARIGTQTEASK